MASDLLGGTKVPLAAEGVRGRKDASRKALAHAILGSAHGRLGLAEDHFE